MLSQSVEDVGTLEEATLRHLVTTKVTTGVRLPSPPPIHNERVMAQFSEVRSPAKLFTWLNADPSLSRSSRIISSGIVSVLLAAVTTTAQIAKWTHFFGIEDANQWYRRLISLKARQPPRASPRRCCRRQNPLLIPPRPRPRIAVGHPFLGQGT